MLPLLVKLQEEQSDIKVYKLNCNKKNKELGVKLNVKVAPTFQLYKNKNKVSASDISYSKWCFGICVWHADYSQAAFHFHTHWLFAPYIPEL